jgi:hypothetical protein
VTRSLNQLDADDVAIAAAGGLLKLFGAAAVEVWVDRPAGPPRGFRGASSGGTYDVVEIAGGPVEHPVAASVVRTLSIGGARVGEVRLWMPPGFGLDPRDQMAATAICEAIAAALHDASAHRALRVLAARSFHDARHDVLTGVANRNALICDGDELLAVLTPGTTVAMLVLGINRLKEVNDTLGHLAGDEVLRTISRS